MNRISDHLAIYDYNGMKLLLDDQSYVDHAILRDGHWEKGEFDFLSAVWAYGSGKRKVFFDIGAYFGIYALNAWMSKQFNEIYAYEADAYNYAQLQAQLFLNEAVDIKAYHLAISDHIGTERISSSLDKRDNRGMTLLTQQGREEIACTTLDALFPNLSGAVVFIKIDVEGHELHALRGMRSIVMNNHTLLQIESYNREPDRYDFLKEYGLQLQHEVFPDIFASNINDLYS